MNQIVSIITPTYNSAPTIEATIKSVIAQSYPYWQLIIVDDASTDGTVNIIKKWQAVDTRISFIQLNENRGAAVARNTAIKASTGRYIAFLDSDDQWQSDKLLKQLQFMTHNQASLSFTAYQKIDLNGNSIGYMGVPKQVDYTTLLKSNVIGCLTAIYDTNAIGRVYMPEIRTRQDYGLWLFILREKTSVAHGLNEVLATYLIRNNSISADKKNAAVSTFKLYRDIEKLGNVKSAYYFCQYAVRGFIRAKYPKMAIKMGFNNNPNNIYD